MDWFNQENWFCFKDNMTYFVNKSMFDEGWPWKSPVY